MMEKIDRKVAIGIGVGLGIGVLYAIRRYVAGGKCTIEKDLSNECAVVTGGNTGIGRETVKRLVELGCAVIVGARDRERNQKLVEEFSKAKGKIVALSLDLSDKQSIQKFVEDVKKQLGDKPLNYLVNNAGMVGLPKKKLTKQGFQMQMGVNHLGHFYLTYLLWDSLKLAHNPRIINVSSYAHLDRASDSKDLDFDDMNFERSQYGPFKAYSYSKRANILFTKELQRRMNEANIQGITISLHPGVVKTDIMKYALDITWFKIQYYLLSPFIYLLSKSPEEGAQTTLYGLLENEEKLKGGQYYVDCKPAPLLSKQCESPESGKKLWQVSQKLWGIKFNL